MKSEPLPKTPLACESCQIKLAPKAPIGQSRPNTMIKHYKRKRRMVSQPDDRKRTFY